MRQQVKDLISQRYRTVEEFCWANDLSKATVSNFLAGRKDFQVSTLQKVANGLKKKLHISLR
ncbi:MAG: hypothetical protein EA369_02175 [Bradymonadales bacterium]|nr:MAG: hypothetical protein EA369_02175 [Bradymonadales bacterium]